MKFQKVFTVLATLVMLLSMTVVSPVSLAEAGGSRQIPSAGTSSPQTGDFTPSGENDLTQAEFPGQLDGEAGPDPFPGSIVNRSFSIETGNGVSVNSGKKAKSNRSLSQDLKASTLSSSVMLAAAISSQSSHLTRVFASVMAM
jgi:hypothetical protein